MLQIALANKTDQWTKIIHGYNKHVDGPELIAHVGLEHTLNQICLPSTYTKDP